MSQATFIEIQRSFPYLVSKEFASGGGDVSPHGRLSIELMLMPRVEQVPEFKWHIIDDRKSFEIENTGIRVSPFAGKRHCDHDFSTFARLLSYKLSPSRAYLFDSAPTTVCSDALQ